MSRDPAVLGVTSGGHTLHVSGMIWHAAAPAITALGKLITQRLHVQILPPRRTKPQVRSHLGRLMKE